MRRVEIVEEPSQTYKWIAIDKGTRQSLLRLSDGDGAPCRSTPASPSGLRR